MTTTHYRLTDGGGWFALVHDGRALLVEASAERAIELWPALVEGADALLDRLTATGLSSAPSFAFAEVDARGGLRTILRGPVAATISSASGPTERSGSGVATWREDADASATAVRLRHDGAPAGGASLPVVSGVVAAAELDIDLDRTEVAAPATAAPAPAASTLPADRIDPAPVATSAASVPPAPTAAAPAPAATDPAQTPVEPDEEATADDGIDDGIDERTSVLPRRTPTHSETETETEPEQVPELTVVPEQTILPTAGGQAESQAEAKATDEEDDYDYLFGSTVVRTVADAAVRDDEPVAVEASPEAAPEPATESTPITEAFDLPAEGDHDGHTVMAADLAELRARRREHGASVPPPAPAPSLHLLRHDGVVESLDQPVLVGRAPSVNQVSAGRMPRLVTVSSLGQDISRNHAQFTVEGGTVVVTDLHSRNGTFIVLPGKSPQKLRQGEPTAVIVGTVVDLGGGVTFTVSED